MAFPIIPILSVVAKVVTPILAKAISGPNAKANGAVVGTAGGVAAGGATYALLDMVLAAFLGGALPELEKGAAMLGALIVGGAINWAIAWLSPAND